MVARFCERYLWRGKSAVATYAQDTLDMIATRFPRTANACEYIGRTLGTQNYFSQFDQAPRWWARLLDRYIEKF